MTRAVMVRTNAPRPQGSPGFFVCLALALAGLAALCAVRVYHIDRTTAALAKANAAKANKVGVLIKELPAP